LLTGPLLTGPLLTGPLLTGPLLTGPLLTELLLTGPLLTEPLLTEPSPTEPSLTEPLPSEPLLTEPSPTMPSPTNLLLIKPAFAGPRPAFAAVLALVAVLLAACIPSHRDEAACPGGPIATVASGPAPTTPATSTPATSTPATSTPAPTTPAPTTPAAEALWIADGAGTLRAIDGRTGRVTATVEVGRPSPPLPPVLAAGGGRLFAYRLDAGDVALLDPATAKVVRHAPVPAARPYASNRWLFAHGALWIAQPGHLWRVTPAGRVTSSVLPPAFLPTALAATGRWLWLADGRTLLRVDPRSPASSAGTPLTPPVAGLTPAGDLYATGVNSPVVRRLDPDSGREIGSFRLTGDEIALSTVDARGLWAVGNCGDLVRLADQHRVRVSDVSQDLPSVAALGSLWVGDQVRSEIVRIDAGSGRVVARMPFAAADPDDPAFGLVSGESTIWVVDGDFGGGVSQVDPVAGRVARVLPGAPATGGLSAVVSASPR
jgi:outer membrane protein assembly factor BamB